MNRMSGLPAWSAVYAAFDDVALEALANRGLEAGGPGGADGRWPAGGALPLPGRRDMRSCGCGLPVDARGPGGRGVCRA